MILEPLKLIHVHTNKCAGISIERAFGFEWADHRTVRQYIRMMGEEAYDKYFSFAVVRNPWDRYFSLYWFKRQGGTWGTPEHIGKHGTGRLNFSDWVINMQTEIPGQGWRPQMHWIRDKTGKPRLSYIARFEKLQEEWETIGLLSGITMPKLPFLNKSDRPVSYRDHYTPKAIESVYNLCREEIEMFSYAY